MRKKKFKPFKIKIKTIREKVDDFYFYLNKLECKIANHLYPGDYYDSEMRLFDDYHRRNVTDSIYNCFSELEDRIDLRQSKYLPCSGCLKLGKEVESLRDKIEKVKIIAKEALNEDEIEEFENRLSEVESIAKENSETMAAFEKRVRMLEKKSKK